MQLSRTTINYLESAKNFIEKTDRPTWTEYFISMAFLASSRSCDSQTKHGCVITDNKNKVLGIGYNSFPCNMPDDMLPNTRPHKYQWMVHAERNALSNCTMRPENGKAYITGHPCLECVKSLYQEGIKHLICVDSHGSHLISENDKIVLEVISEYGGLKVDWIKPNE